MPTLMLDRTKCLGNIERMARKAKRHGLGFRPHFKTHQSAGVGEWFRDFGVSKITVSSFRMAEYFAGAGWKDILVDSMEVLPFLDKLPYWVPFYIDIDTGYGRTGVRSDDLTLIERIIRDARKNRNLEFIGFYCHAGHSYQAGGPAERAEIHRKALSDLNALKKQFSRPDPQVLYGDTPGCSTQEEFEGIDTITPGNFVFYDLFQCSIGSCREEEIAVAVECPVVSKYARDRKILIHGGAVHFFKEVVHLDGRPVFGKVVAADNQLAAGKGMAPGFSWSAMKDPVHLSEISQEHGIIRDCPPAFFEGIRIGDPLCILPVHSCLTANLMGGYVTLEGEKIGMMA